MPDLNKTGRTFARMLKAALFSDSVNRTARYQQWEDTRVIPDAILLTHDQLHALKTTAHPYDITILDSGDVVFMGVKVYATGVSSPEHPFTDAFDARDLPLHWDDLGAIRG